MSETAAPREATNDGVFPIVAIGCSAGGLAALESFFRALDAACGMAFVVVQHLSPAHASALPELVASFTSMPVAEVIDGVRVQPGHVYIISPGHDLSLLAGCLHLSARVLAPGLHLPIDAFMRSLAAERRELAVGVVLSGMGTDGTFGLAAIKEQAGLTLVQEPSSAMADAMPRSAIDAGVADIVALPADMPKRLATWLNMSERRRAAQPLAQADVLTALDRINGLLRESSGNDFSLYKPNTLLRRIERRMAVRDCATMDDYGQLLRRERQELEFLFKELLIGVTEFFRDAEVWSHLREEVLPEWLRRAAPPATFRAWVAGCSTGEEAYSLAMVLMEAMSACDPPLHASFQIYATDLDPAAIEVARKGVYPATIASAVSAERLLRFFVAEEGGSYRVSRSLRENVVFAVQNIAADPPFTKLDLLSCRNLLIYFGSQLQKQLLPMFHYALNPGGVLVLGNAESISGFGQLFTPLNQKARIFRRDASSEPLAAPTFSVRGPLFHGGDGEPQAVERDESLGALTDQLVQQQWAPAAVLVNADGDILYISGRTGRYLEPAAGKTNMNVHAMAREGLRDALTGMVRKALADQRPVELRGLRVTGDGASHVVDVIVQPLERPELLRGRVLIVFKDAPAPKARRRSGLRMGAEEQQAMALELQQAREALQVTHEEMQTTVEELRSSNEELQSTNEELQSTNEELTTSKEELQSVNEELQTVNAELQSKVDDLAWVRNDMANLLNSTDIATVFLDAEMKLRRYTSSAVRIFRLIPGDVGRLLSDVVTDLVYPQLVADAREVLRTLVFKEVAVDTRDGRWFRVRVMPYRTQENVIDGVVITFTDITEIKRLEAQLRNKSGEGPHAG